MKKILSIIIPIYNNEKYIENTLLSILSQKKDFVELIVVDGKSKDSTLNIIEKYKSKIDLIISEEDNGVYDAMNKGIKVATGEWLYFLGSDDLLAPYVIEKIQHILKEKNTIYYGDVYRPKTNVLYDGKFSRWKIVKKNICHQAIFYPKSVFEKYTYDLNFSIQADYHLNMLCFVDIKYNFKYHNILIAYYNDEIDGISRNKIDYKFLKSKEKIIKEKYGFQYLIYYLSLYYRAKGMKILRSMKSKIISYEK